MRIPNKLKAFGTVISVIKVEEPTEITRDGNCIGRYDADASCIVLTKRTTSQKLLSPDVKCETFLHEVLHVINNYMLEDTRRLEEGQIDQMSKGLFAIIKDNKLRFDE